MNVNFLYLDQASIGNFSQKAITNFLTSAEATELTFIGIDSSLDFLKETTTLTHPSIDAIFPIDTSAMGHPFIRKMLAFTRIAQKYELSTAKLYCDQERRFTACKIEHFMWSKSEKIDSLDWVKFDLLLSGELRDDIVNTNWGPNFHSAKFGKLLVALQIFNTPTFYLRPPEKVKIDLPLLDYHWMNNNLVVKHV